MTQYHPDEIFTIKEACERILKNACKPSHLRNEHKAGRLSLLKIGKRYCVTPAMLNDWLQLCLRKRSRLASTSTEVKVSGSSAIDHTQSALDALSMNVSKLKKPSRNTSRSSTPTQPKPNGRTGS
ncbi:hypothetical protein [Brucella intermedia]|uniref:hypothetical protein n=1 Tax=Brucella intermedia TaxID=94625 RepID=UPI001558D421|nr:hypothetical protein [Brucella intermedia]NKB96846.1 hypothetical protein [Brucella intermedia]